MAKLQTSVLRRYLIIASAGLILVLQAGASRVLKIDENAIQVPDLRGMPWQIGRWQAHEEQSIGKNVEQYLKPDTYILRDYVDPRTGAATSLFVAYFKSVQNVYGPHSPSVCMPGAGWLEDSSRIAKIIVPGRTEPIPVREFTMEKGGQRILMLYWYQNDRAIWAEEFHAKLRLLPDLLRYRRSDESLVRLIAPLNSPTGDQELANTVEFSQQVFPLLAQRFSATAVQRP